MYKLNEWLVPCHDVKLKKTYRSVGGSFFRMIEQAGQAHFDLVILRSQGIYTYAEEPEPAPTPDYISSTDTSTTNSPALSPETKARYAQRQRKKKGTAKKELDYYELLGLGHLRWSATEKDIKKACKFE